MPIIVYHGSTDTIERPICKFGRNGLDFGKGFYVTDIRSQAERWARRLAFDKDKTPLLNIYHLDKEAFLREARCKIFTAYDREWLHFIVNNRLGKNAAADFDYVEGGVANDRVIDSIMEYMQGRINEETTLGNLAYHKPNNQICLLNQSFTDKFLTYDHTESL